MTSHLSDGSVGSEWLADMISSRAAAAAAAAAADSTFRLRHADNGLMKALISFLQEGLIQEAVGPGRVGRVSDWEMVG